MRHDKLTPAALNLALALWGEQLTIGLGYPGETVTADKLGDWLDNRDGETLRALQDAADGDLSALAVVRIDAGLPVFSGAF